MNKKELKKYLKGLGYTYAVMLSSNNSEFYATKEEKLSNGDFSNESLWDCFTLEDGDVWIKENTKNPYNTICKI